MKTKIIKGIESSFYVTANRIYPDHESEKAMIFFTVNRVEFGKGKIKALVPLSNCTCLEDAFMTLRNFLVVQQLGDTMQIEKIIKAVEISNELILENINDIKKQIKKGKIKPLQKFLNDDLYFNRFRLAEEKKRESMIEDMQKFYKPKKKLNL